MRHLRLDIQNIPAEFFDKLAVALDDFVEQYVPARAEVYVTEIPIPPAPWAKFRPNPIAGYQFIGNSAAENIPAVKAAYAKFALYRHRTLAVIPFEPETEEEYNQHPSGFGRIRWAVYAKE